jgi:hypothetical protein
MTIGWHLGAGGAGWDSTRQNNKVDTNLVVVLTPQIGGCGRSCALVSCLMLCKKEDG